MSECSVVPLKRLELRYEPQIWPFAIEHRSEIDTHFAKLKLQKPAVWNGRILMLRNYAIAGSVFCGTFFDADFASFLAWRDWGFPDDAVRNCFALGALRCPDGYLLGVMGAHTVSAGKIYFAAGTPDLDDIVGDAVDLAGSVRREVAEETGLTPKGYVAEESWYCVLAGPRIALIKTLHSPDSADQLRARILLHLAQEAEPELADIRIVRTSADLDPDDAGVHRGISAVYVGNALSLTAQVV